MIPIEEAFRQAVENIAENGDTDVFPLPMENHVLHDVPDDVVGLLVDFHGHFTERLATNGPVNESALAMVGYASFRWATQLDPIWNAYFLGIVLAIADDIERARVPVEENRVFSYRYQPDPVSKRLFTDGGWRDFQTESLRHAEASSHVVTCDIADFYSRVYHHRLENALRAVDGANDIPWRITSLLANFSGNTSYSLPVGGPAARILAELLLNRVDRLLTVAGIDWLRFADDYHIFVDAESDGYGALLTISDLLLRNEGLTLQKAKTRILSSDEFKASSVFAPDGPAGTDPQSRRFLTLSLRYDPYSPTAVEDYEALKEQVQEFDIAAILTREIQKSRISPSLTRRLLQALQFTPAEQKAQIALTLIDSLDNLAPVFPSVMRAIRALADDLSPTDKDAIATRLRGLVEGGSYLTRVDVNLAYMIRVMAMSPSPENEAFLAHLFDRDVPGFVKRDIVLVMARWGATYWLSDKKTRFSTMHAWVKRAFVVASYSLRDEGRHWRIAVRPSLAPFDRITAQWMEGRVAAAGWEIPL